MEIIKITVDSTIANLYNNMNAMEQKKINLLLGIWLKETLTNQKSLIEVMEECSQEAQTNGLTPEILEEILLEK